MGDADELLERLAKSIEGKEEKLAKMWKMCLSDPEVVEHMRKYEEYILQSKLIRRRLGIPPDRPIPTEMEPPRPQRNQSIEGVSWLDEMKRQGEMLVTMHLYQTRIKGS